MFFAEVAFSGGLRFTLDLNGTREKDAVLLSCDFGLCGYTPLTVIKPGESVKMPEIHFGMLTGDSDDAVNEMNDHIRGSVLTLPSTSGDALLVGAGMGAEHDMSVGTAKAFMRQMKEMGGEVFIIDGGWKCPSGEEMRWWEHNGKNLPDGKRYPNGLSELKAYASEIGLKFGLWMEPERLGLLSPAYKEHPEWFAKGFFGDTNTGYIDLTIPEAASWVENEAARVIEEYGLDLFRVDHNGSPDYFCMKDFGSGIKECENFRSTNAVYTLYRHLKERFPYVIFENCAGGGRIDLGMMKAFNHSWVSDWQRMPRSVTITSGMTLVLPPERVDRLFAGMNSHVIGSLMLNMRNTMTGHMSLNVINTAAAEINREAMEFIRHSVALYKNFIRPFLPTSKIYHHTPETQKALDEGFSALELSAADKSRGVIHAAALTSPKRKTVSVYPRGLDRSKTYTVTFDNSGESFTESGQRLMNDGICLTLPSALTSELILFDAE